MRPLSNAKGFSLLEVLVASVVLVVCLLPVVTLSQRGLTETMINQEELLCRQILIDLCERYKTVSPKELQFLSENPGSFDDDPFLLPLKHQKVAPLAGQGNAQTAGLNIRRRISVNENLDGTVGLHRVRFEVTWTSCRGRDQTVSLTKLIHHQSVGRSK